MVAEGPDTAIHSSRGSNERDACLGAEPSEVAGTNFLPPERECRLPGGEDELGDRKGVVAPSLEACDVRANSTRPSSATLTVVRCSTGRPSTSCQLISTGVPRSPTNSGKASVPSSQGKPVAMTEFGAATYRGASDRGARALEIVEYAENTRAPIRLNGEYIRDEAAQARYLRELLEVFEAEGVDSAFVFIFALRGYVHRPDGDAHDDLDLASYGIVKMLEGRHGDAHPDMLWEPEAAFTALAKYFREQ